MKNGELRTSQIVMTFGPGSMVDLPEASVIVSGLDDWKYDKTDMPTISEPRLVDKIRNLLGVQELTLRKPPPAADQGQHGFHPVVTGWRFPEWFISQKADTTKKGFRRRRLMHWNQLEKGRFLDENDRKKYSVVPIRFVRACKRGHVGDIAWPEFAHGSNSPCGRGELWIEERGTTGDLEEVWVVCGCGAERAVAQAARLELQALGRCNGSRPWLGPGTKEKCGDMNRLLVRSASNAYFPQLLSVISIPDQVSPVDDVVRSAWDVGLAIVDSRDKLPMVRAIPAVAEKLQGMEDDVVWESIQRIRSGTSRESLPVKEAEFDVLSSAVDELTSDEPEGIFFARSLPRETWEAPWMETVEKIVLVHRLREVVAQLGFTRFEAAGTDIQGELDFEVTRAPIAIDSTWLPAVENRGEGLFIQFKTGEIDRWLNKAPVIRRMSQLVSGFDIWKKQREESKREFPGMPYIFLHSFAHLLLNAISLECGYPASSLRERVYSIPKHKEEEAGYGVLIYTGSTDAEGTLGGLILAAREIKKHFRQALRMALLCSNDPVCANHQPNNSEQQPLSGAACHSCLYVSETSCEQRNEFLDRALVVKTVEQCEAEFFTDF